MAKNMTSKSAQDTDIYVVKIGWEDRLDQCHVFPLSDCAQCRDLKLFGIGEEPFYLKAFETLEDAVLWKMKGHIVPAPHFTVDREKFIRIIEQAERIRENKRASDRAYEVFENRLARALESELHEVPQM